MQLTVVLFALGAITLCFGALLGWWARGAIDDLDRLEDAEAEQATILDWRRPGHGAPPGAHDAS